MILLLTLDVPGEVFLGMQNENLKDLEKCNLKNASIYKYFSSESYEAI